ncbi:hypothetical protein [Mycolicibacterium baixiangningiae]|uniref:hypothetical protein n=1 Tax=Mycolicibacterium baixiangningiae TaxID=2761578 RepID=UPI0018D15D2B|nr:hypothetical protein [Mycolicibacterium baixiangningiae]
MTKGLLSRTWFVVSVLALTGLMAGVVAANVLVGRQGERYTASTTLAMLPGPQIPADQVAAFWEVLGRGQATRSAAIVLGDGRWLEGAAAAAEVPKGELALTSGAVVDTTLIDVTMTANTPGGAEAALQSVITEGAALAESVSGPYRLEPISSPAGSAQAMGPALVQVRGACAIAGLLIGAGAGFLLSRFARRAPSRAGEPHGARLPLAGTDPVDGSDVQNTHRRRAEVRIR